MGTDLLTNQGRILIASESGGYGVDAIDLANNLAVNRRYLPVRTFPELTRIEDFIEIPRVRGAGSTEAHEHIPGGTGVTLITPLPGAIDPGTTEYPDIWPLLKACGFTEARVAGVSSTFSVATTQQDAVSMYAYQASAQQYQFRLHPAFGLRGNVTIGGSLRSEGICTFTMESPTFRDTRGDGNPVTYRWVSDEHAFFDAAGLIDKDLDGNAIIYTGSEVYADPAKPITHNITITVDGVTFRCESYLLNMNRAINRIEGVCGATTIQEVMSLFLSAPTLDLVFQSSGADYEKIVDLLLSASEISASIVHSLGTGNDRITITMPKAQARGPARTDSGGIIARSVQLAARGDFGESILGNNDVTVVWDVAP